MIGFSVKRVIKKLQGKMHEWLQCKSRTPKNVVKNTMIGFSGKNVLKKISEKCMKSVKMCIFHFQCKIRSGIRSLPPKPMLTEFGIHYKLESCARFFTSFQPLEDINDLDINAKLFHNPHKHTYAIHTITYVQQAFQCGLKKRLDAGQKKNLST